jgi:hypothetical protein
MIRYVSQIFEEEPKQWGLRGDPFLWRHLKDKYLNTVIPYSPEKLEQDIIEEIKVLTNEYPKSDKHYHVKQFATKHVGMSTGFISGKFWLEKGILLLKERLTELNTNL